MKIVTAMNLQEAESYLFLGEKVEVELAFSITTDEFFTMASDWCERGAKIKKGDKFFSIFIKDFHIPPND
ncbi:hypothetical protein MXM51_21515 [Pantoea stewartii]|uniref:hypothetical protein n=1 Tax=Pantoea stewartii TaxID=66269 RepID=UPI002DBC1240|nr:hypothetical protein [Pantoea stewartii]MEB6537094.1 hypothetical protein [Pantoea stewartii]